MAQSPFLPESRQWEFTDRSGEKRVYEQSELTIDGEAQLFALLARQIARLRDAGFPFEAFGNIYRDPKIEETEFPNPDDPEHPLIQRMVIDQGGLDVAVLGNLLTEVASLLPGFVAEGAAVMLGIFPTDEDGKRNVSYPEEVKFLRRTVHLADAAEMLEEFTRQNDVERLQAPFVKAVGAFRALGRTSPNAPAQPHSTEDSISSSQPDTGGPGRLPDGSRGPRSTRR